MNLILPLLWTSPQVIWPPSVRPLAFVIYLAGKSLKDLDADRPQVSSDEVTEMLSLFPCFQRVGDRYCVRYTSLESHLLFPSVAGHSPPHFLPLPFF